MKVFGIGLSKTATTSLNEALNILGFRAVHNINTPSKLFRIDAATDVPIAARYKELDVIFPGSKFIMTVRNIDSWIKSYESHKKRINIEALPAHDKFEVYWIRARIYGSLNPDRDQSIEGYNKHVVDVMEYFSNRPNDLLVLDICGGEGWNKLCPFLNKTLVSVPFPHLNKS